VTSFLRQNQFYMLLIQSKEFSKFRLFLNLNIQKSPANNMEVKARINRRFLKYESNGNCQKD